MKTLLWHQSLHNAPFTKISVNLRDVWVKAHSIANLIQVQELRDIKSIGLETGRHSDGTERLGGSVTKG